MEREIKGWHVAAGMVTAFGIIIGVNVTMAVKAVGTFPGLEVKNSYVASQSFDARREAQVALGWSADVKVERGQLHLTLTDATSQAVRPADLKAMLGRPTIARADQLLELTPEAYGFSAPVDLEQGAWLLKLTATGPDGVAFEKRLDLWVP